MPAVSVPIIDQLIHPAIGLLSEATIAGAFTGDGTLTPPQNPLVALTYGIRWSFFTVPAGFGKLHGNPDIYFDRILELASEYVLLSGSNIVQQVQGFSTDGACYFWDEPLPLQIRYSIAPGVVINFQWLQT